MKVQASGTAPVGGNLVVRQHVCQPEYKLETASLPLGVLGKVLGGISTCTTTGDI